MCKQRDSKASFQKGTKKSKYVKPDNLDASDTRPNYNKEKQAIRSEIASVFKEQFALNDERDLDFDKFESIIASIFVGGDKKKPASHASGSIAAADGTAQDSSSQLRA